MLRYMCKSKIHRPTVTEANLKYTGSITIDSRLLKAADILPYERVQVVNVNNGTRFETYVIEGRTGSGVICLNGPAARWGEVGDEIIIMSYALMGKEELINFKAKIIFVDKKNRIVKKK